MDQQTKSNSIISYAANLGIKLDTSQVQIAKQFDKLNIAIHKTNTFFSFFSEPTTKGIYVYGGVGRENNDNGYFLPKFET